MRAVTMCLGMVLAAVIASWGFGQQPSAAVTNEASTVVKVGVIAPLTGPAAELGIEIRRGIELAHKLHLGIGLELVYEDGACDAKQAMTAATKLTSIDKVTVVIGPLCSPPFMATAPMFERAKVVHIHSSSGTQNTDRLKGKYGIEGTGTVMDENSYLAKYIHKSGYRKLALIHVEQEWASGHAKAFEEEFTKLGGEITAHEVFTNVGETDFRNIILKVRAKRPDALYLPSYNRHIATILKQMKSLHWELPVFRQYDVENQAVIDQAGDAANGLRYSYPFDNVNLTPQALAFVEAYEAAYNVKPSFYPFNGYDILMLVDRAVAACGGNAECIHANITATKDYEGLTGAISFTNGSVSRNFVMKKVDNRQFVLITAKYSL